MIKFNFFFCALFAGILTTSAQVTRKTFPLSREFKKSGFSIAPLAIISFGNSNEASRILENGDRIKFKEEGRGEWDIGLELGWFKTFEGYKVGDYFEAALSYRRFSGEHNLESDLTSAQGGLSAPIKFENSFDIEKFSFALRAIDIAWQKPKHFLTWGFGVNYDYLIADKYDKDYPVDFNATTQFEDKHALQVHFQLGYGFTVAKYVRFIPTLETPLVGFVPDSPNPGIQFFDIDYQPLVIGLKLMFLRKDPVNCNAPRLKNAPVI